VWEQAKNPRTSPEKKARPLFSAGEGRKREQYIGVEQGRAGVILHGEKKLEEVYNSKVQFSALINGWENWEPKDKSKKDARRTYCTREEEDNNKMSSKKKIPQEKNWWEEEDKGYNTDRDLKAEYDWEDKQLEKLRRDLVWMKEQIMMETARLKKTKTSTAKIMMEREGTTSKRYYVGKWWEGLLTNLRRKTMMTTNGPKNIV
jgi:hypothetical protein